MTFTAPVYDAIEQWKATGNSIGYCMTGKYRTYRGDADNTAGSTLPQMNSTAALLGWPIECIMIGGGINSSLNGLPQHLVIHQAMFPYNGSNPLGSLHLAATATTYQSFWQQTVDALTAQGINNGQVTLVLAWEGSGSNNWGGMGGTDPNTGVASTAADYKGAWVACVTYMRSHGLSTAVTFEWNVMTGGLSASGLLAMYPGDNYVDICGWDGYAANRLGLSNRNNFQYLWDNDMKRDMDTLTNFAAAHGKLCGMSEMGVIQAVPGDTTSNAYLYRPADTSLYFKLLCAYVALHADIWVYLCLFDENQPYGNSTGAADITEDDKFIYYGTNPATQTYPRLFSTSTGGTAYLTTSPQHALSKGDYVVSMKAGTMQLPQQAPPGTTGVTLSKSATRFVNAQVY